MPRNDRFDGSPKTFLAFLSCEFVTARVKAFDEGPTAQ
jgi:hypothetical protein